MSQKNSGHRPRFLWEIAIPEIAQVIFNMEVACPQVGRPWDAPAYFLQIHRVSENGETIHLGKTTCIVLLKISIFTLR